MGKKNIAIVGESVSGECISSLNSFGYRVVILPRDVRLGRYVATHTDLLVFPLEDRFFVYGGEARDMLDAVGLSTFTVDEIPEEKYPYDVYLNALTVGKYIFARKKYLSAAIISYAERLGYTIVDVHQGYARCTACPISENAIITADPSISAAASAKGIEVLSVSSANVELIGYPYGFIGGACGISDGRVFFTGDIYTHSDGERIVEFCGERGKEVVSLCSGPLRDVGGIFFV